MYLLWIRKKGAHFCAQAQSTKLSYIVSNQEIFISWLNQTCRCLYLWMLHNSNRGRPLFILTSLSSWKCAPVFVPSYIDLSLLIHQNKLMYFMAIFLRRYRGRCYRQWSVRSGIYWLNIKHPCLFQHKCHLWFQLVARWFFHFS